MLPRSRRIPFAIYFGLIGLASPVAGQDKDRLAKRDRAVLGRDVAAVLESHGHGVRASLWLGGADGAAWYALDETVPRPTASAIKAFYLVELFDRNADRLDKDLPGAAAILKDDRHPAIAHFSADQRDEIRRELGGASVRKIGEVMIGKAKASNAVYNAAANLVTAAFDGPATLTKAIHKRDASFKAVEVRRYMLADRAKPGDNEATAEALAAVHRRLAAGKLAGVDAETMKVIRDVLRFKTDATLGASYGKHGTLTSDPLTEVRAGCWETKAGPFVYVVMVAQPTPDGEPRLAAAAALNKTVVNLTEQLVAAGRKALEP